MTRQEMMVVMGILQDAYPRFYSGKTKDELIRALDLWAEIFSDNPSAVVIQAVKLLIMELQFPPTIADVKARMDLLVRQPQKTSAEVWSCILKAICNSNYNSVAEFDNLPLEAQRIVKTPSQLKLWAQMDLETINSVIQSNCLKQYAAQQKEDKQRENIPHEFRISQGADLLMIEDK